MIEGSVPENMTQDELAMNIGLSRASLVNMMAGKQAISIMHLYEIAESLNMEAKDFLPDMEWYKKNKGKKLKKIITFEVIDDEDI